MPLKKSELYSSLWASCDALRGGMDASQYKDYVLVLLFLKYVSDKYASDPDGVIHVPKKGSFKHISSFKNHKDVGEEIDKAIGALARANDLEKVIDMVSFNDEEKLGKGKEMVDRLTELISIFEKPELDFSKNRAEGDDLLGDAYEYLMRHFATESGKSKGQFYTPAEVSRVIAKVIGIKNPTNRTSFYDPTCGSGSLLLKLLDEAEGKGTLYGQEKEVATAGLAKMNMILHNSPTAEIVRGQSTLSHPLFHDKNGYLQTFDYIVSNPPFSLKNWTSGFDPLNDEFDRFTGFGIPPEKNGDYAFLLHIVKSLKSNGKAAVILPHGVLFRGGSEAQIRKNLIDRGLIKGVIGLPANLFYGTGIPACIIIIDKEGADERKGIFMIDASKGFMKDGNKNRLREQDMHRMVDTFNRQETIVRYSRYVKKSEIADAKNDYNLNIPRYIDSQEPEDLQDIAAHLLGGIPNADIDALQEYWNVYPSLRRELFGDIGRKGYSKALVEKDKVKETIFKHPEFVAVSKQMDKVFMAWRKRIGKDFRSLKAGLKPKKVIHQISEDLLQTYSGKPLIDKYDVYQHLMDYWAETMQDDLYLIAIEGWKAEPYRILIKNKQGKEVDKGWTCDLVPPALIISHFFSKEREEFEQLQEEKGRISAEITELEEEHGAEERLFTDFEKVNRAAVQKRLNELLDKHAKKVHQKTGKTRKNVLSVAAEPAVTYEMNGHSAEYEVLQKYLGLHDQLTSLSAKIRGAEASLDKKALLKYAKLSTEEIKDLVVEKKWMDTVEAAVKAEMDAISQRLTRRIKELEERYEQTLPELSAEVKALEEKVNVHLEKMGFVWN
jgi:type I restriction enzyme M protein